MIETAPFGSTGHESTRTIFGAAALGSVSQAEADRTLELLLEHGVNHIDTAASYGDSELRIAPWLARHPDRFFVATKTEEREYTRAREQIRRSLDRLGVDRIDLLQLHNLVDVIEWEFALREGGALDAAVHWVLSRPGVFLNTVGDVTLLPKVLDAASRFASGPPNEALEDLTARRKLVPLFS